MSLFSNKISWVAGSFFVFSAIFGASNQQASPTPPMLPGYNAPAPCSLQNSWDVFFTGSFIYWSPNQENMELGIVSHPSSTIYAIDGQVTNLESKYSPGFQVGIGANLTRDTWDSFLRYTWLRSHESATTSLNHSGIYELSPFWQVPLTQGGTNPSYFYGHEEWKLHMDLLDVELGRTYFVGKELVLRPFFGARAAWIRQNIDVEYLNEANVNPTANVYIHQNFNSWGVGPRTGVSSHWMLGKNFRLFGDGAGDILFTQYHTLRCNQYGTYPAGASVPNSGFITSQHDSNHLRGHVELEFGLGWETDCQDKNWHMDLSAGYTYQIFFDQNMFRHFVNNFSFVSILPSGNLYIHGLTLTARCDF